MLRRFFTFILAALACACACAQDAAQKTVDITKTWDSKTPIYRISISGPDEAAVLTTRALSTHGSFRITNADAHFAIEIAKAQNGAVDLKISGAKPFAQTVQGKNTANAVAKACDLVAAKILGEPAYFTGTLAFVSDRTGHTEIYTSDMLFQNIRSITSDKSDSMLPHWSPDGSKIIYTGYFRTKLMDLYEIDLRTKTRKTFASFKGTNTGGAFSPDGSKIAMILTASGNAEIWTCSAGANAKNNLKKITNSSAAEASASWSPSGKELIFSSDAMGSPQLYTMPAAGGQMKRVPTNISGYCSEPDWNKRFPNLIAFTTAQSGAFQIAVYDFNTKQSRVITTGGSSSMPKWTNDGRHIIFTKTQGKSRTLYIVDSITQKQTALHSKNLGNCAEADFLPTK
ncbi:MAG: PD40 domain-containing protein [Opitutales bacterium]|nr:PD40 domain-containing protein [Opitutales bacterium]